MTWPDSSGGATLRKGLRRALLRADVIAIQ